MRPLMITIMTFVLFFGSGRGGAQTPNDLLRDYAQLVDWGQRSALLNVGLTEQQVIQTVGYGPNKVEMQTCGQNSRGGAWSCKLYTFGDSYYHLTVYFHQDERGWVVNSWSVFP